MGSLSNIILAAIFVVSATLSAEALSTASDVQIVLFMTARRTLNATKEVGNTSHKHSTGELRTCLYGERFSLVVGSPSIPSRPGRKTFETSANFLHVKSQS